MSRPKDHTIPACGRTMGHLPVPDNAKHSAFIHPSVWLYSWFKRLSSSGGIAAQIIPLQIHGSRPTRLMPSLMVGARTLWYLAKLTTSFPSVPTLTLNSSNTLAVRVLRVRFLTNLELLWRTKGDVGVHVVLSLADKAKSKSLMWKWYNNHIEFNINNINEKSNNHMDRAHIWLHNTW